MKTFLVLVFCLLVMNDEGIGAEVKSIGSNPEAMKWRKQILQGISVFPKIGLPGRIVVYGKHAEPILTGSNEEDVLVAAAEFGKGRIVAISHGGYSTNFIETDHSTADVIRKFHTNLKQWLTRGTYENKSSIINARDSVTKDRLMSSKVVVFDGGVINIPVENMTEYVRNGGALLHCLTPWGWLQLNERKTLSDVSYVSLLGEAGIYYTDEYLSAPDEGLSVKDNKAADAHLLRVLEYVGTNIDKAAEKVNMLKTLQYLPKEETLKLSNTVGKIMDSCTEEIEKRIIPSETEPITNKRDKAILAVWRLCYDLKQPLNVKAPGVNLFPGDFSTEPELKTHTVEIHSDFHSTGCYLPAGQTLKVEVLSGNEGHDWELMIGCHTDEIDASNNELKRWPKVNYKDKLLKKTFEMSTPFGGMIYLISPEIPKQSIRLKLENVVDSPRFRLTEGKKGKTKWEQSRLYPGLWADISGELITITLNASSVRELEFDALTSVMQTWDSIVRLYHDLRGTDVSKFRRQWFVTDVQLNGDAYMLAGYPIRTYPDVGDPNFRYFLLNGTNLQKYGNWAAFHEIGHSMQRVEWTFDGAWELTVNIFTLCAMDVICHIKPWIHPYIQNDFNDAQRFLKDEADLRNWKSNGSYAIFVYAQLARDFGWESYKKVFRRYEAMDDSEKPKDNRMKIDMWFSIFSEIVGLNLSPLALFWAIPISDETLTRLQIAFPVAFLPDDVVTRFSPDRVKNILSKFASVVIKTSVARLNPKQKRKQNIHRK